MSDMKVIMESWDKFVVSEQEEPAQTAGQKASAAYGKVSSIIAKGFRKMDAHMQKDYCEKKFPLHLKGQGDIQTWGDLVALMKCGIEYSNRKKVLAAVAGYLPGIGPAIAAIQNSNDMSQFIMQAYQVSDDERPEGNLGKLDMDDEVAAIIDNKVEKAVLKFLVKELTDTKNLELDIDPNWDVTTALQAHLTTKYNDRTVTTPAQGE